MNEALTWWLALEALGLIAFPFAFLGLRFLADRGYSLSKMLGVLLMTYFLWLGANLHIAPNRRPTVIAIFFLLIAASAVVGYRNRHEIRTFVAQRWRHLLAMEVLFAAMFFVALFLHSYSADIFYAGSEKPTDNAVLNAVLRNEYFPPKDPWLAGYDINYYYFGHTAVATMVRLTGVASSVGFNLALPMIVSLAGIGIVGVAYNLMIDRTRLRYVLLVGVTGVVFFTILSNLEGVLELMRAHGIGSAGFYKWFHVTGLEGPGDSTEWYPTESYWWSRVYTFDFWPSQLFPFPRLRFGELRPEIMSFAFSVLLLGTAVNLWRSTELIGTREWWRRSYGFALPALALGALIAVHTWDAPTFFFVLVAAVAARNYLIERRIDGRSLLRLGAFAGALFLISVLVFAPYYRTDFASFQGLRLLEAPSTSRPQHLLLMWLPMLWLAGSLAAVSIGRWRPSRRLALLALAVPLGVLAVWALAFLFKAGLPGLIDEIEAREARWLSAGILAAALFLVALALLAHLRESEHEQRSGSAIFALLMVGTGLLIIYGIEFFWVKDPSWLPRFNTSIRANMQGWLLLGVGGGLGLYYIVTTWRPRTLGASLARGAWGIATLAVLAGGFVYPLTATFSTTNDFSVERHIEGLWSLKQGHPGEYDAITWLRDDLPGTPVIIEAVDLSYTPYSRVSSYTGLPTVLGWDQHEFWWRGGDWTPQDGRKEAIDQIYTGSDPAQVTRLLNQYDAEYVYVGWLEKEKYGPQVGSTFGSFMDIAYQNSEVTIYRMREAPAQAALEASE